MLEYGIGDDDRPGVNKLIIEYSQPADTCDNQKNWQTLRIESEDGGGGPYFNLYIPTGHWSINDENDIKLIIEDFKERLNYKA